MRHTRTSPLRNDFTYHSCAWLVDLSTDQAGGKRLWWRTPFVRFRAKDHLGDPTKTWRQNVIDFAAGEGVDLSGAGIQVLTGACTSGYAFDPLSVYWCAPAGEPPVVIAEVRNTYGGRHCYLLRTDRRDVATTEKQFYVSPFNDVSGSYTLVLAPPQRDGFDVTITLHRDGERPFVARWQGHRPRTPLERLRFGIHAPVAAQLVTARIHWQGVRLWARRLPVQPRPSSDPQEA
ncbi:DUF1365 domain-containing protein [Rudaeicoccus suwonensis]|uniref:DUF1365 domain-containing protein n=1 Tax=Rudaeicoccus suwonensis TaxID=657409 RepID=UPI001FE82901|nr:DUF1365 domain-containing protein [Rudaeicoccus suwonensis]